MGALYRLLSEILIPGLTVTIPLTVISFTFALIIAVIMALVQFANVKVLKQIARFYIWSSAAHRCLCSCSLWFFGLSRIGLCSIRFRRQSRVLPDGGRVLSETIRAAP